MSDQSGLEKLRSELARQGQFLQTEFGYQSESPGNLPRIVQDNQEMLRDIEQTLRGTGDEMGLVGWMTVIRRTWISLVALLGAAAGYFLNDIVEALQL